MSIYLAWFFLLSAVFVALLCVADRSKSPELHSLMDESSDRFTVSPEDMIQHMADFGRGNGKTEIPLTDRH